MEQLENELKTLKSTKGIAQASSNNNHHNQTHVANVRIKAHFQ